MTSPRSILLSAGARGTSVDVPESVELLPVQFPADPGATQSATQQQELFRNALNTPQSGPALKELAKGHRRVAVLVGDLSQPAPYDLVLPELIQALVETEIRPSRISFLVYPGHGAQVLGRGAIRRYGEQAVGDHELRVWTWGDNGPAETDPFFDAADLRLAVRPVIENAPLPQSQPVDLEIQLSLSRKANPDIEQVLSRRPLAGESSNQPGRVETVASDVWLSGGGGGEWEQTLEEALLSWHRPANATTAVLAFSGEDGLGSARFANDLWALLREADEVIAQQGALPAPPDSDAAPFDPAAVVAAALGRYKTVVLFSPWFMEHAEGEDLGDRLLESPHTGAKFVLCANQPALWSTLTRLHGERFRLNVEPLGWRTAAGGRQ